MKMDNLKIFRQKAYQLLGNDKDATMDLIHAELVTCVFLSGTIIPVFRRKCSSFH